MSSYLLGDLTAEQLRTWSTERLVAKAEALEATDDGDGFLSRGDEYDLDLVRQEIDRRDSDPDLCQACGQRKGGPEATWFVVTSRPARSNQATVVLVEARSGADVEDALRRHGLDGADRLVAWEPLSNQRAVQFLASAFIVLPWGTR